MQISLINHTRPSEDPPSRSTTLHQRKPLLLLPAKQRGLGSALHPRSSPSVSHHVRFESSVEMNCSTFGRFLLKSSSHIRNSSQDVLKINYENSTSKGWNCKELKGVSRAGLQRERRQVPGRAKERRPAPCCPYHGPWLSPQGSRSRARSCPAAGPVATPGPPVPLGQSRRGDRTAAATARQQGRGRSNEPPG